MRKHPLPVLLLIRETGTKSQQGLTRTWKTREPPRLPGRCETAQPLWVMAPRAVRHRVTHYPASVPGKCTHRHLPGRNKIHACQERCAPTFTAALCLTEDGRGPGTQDLVKGDLYCVHGGVSLSKKVRTLTSATICEIPGHVTLSDRSPSQRTTDHVTPSTRKAQKRHGWEAERGLRGAGGRRVAGRGGDMCLKR